MSTPSDKEKPNPTRNLNVQPDAAAKVKGGKPLDPKVEGESKDHKHPQEIEIMGP